MANQANSSGQLSALLRSAIEQSSHSYLILRQRILVFANLAARRTFGMDDSALDQLLRIDGPGGLLVERVEEITASAISDKNAFDYRPSPAPDQPEQLLAVTVTVIDADHTLVEAIPARRPAELQAAQLASQLRHKFKTPLAVIKLGLSHFSHNYDKLSEQERLAIVEEITQEITRLTKDVDALTATK